MASESPKWLKNLEKYMPGPETKYNKEPHGFWVGLLHGIIVPLTFIYRFYQPHVKLVENENIDSGYNFGYLLGVVAILKALLGIS